MTSPGSSIPRCPARGCSSQLGLSIGEKPGGNSKLLENPDIKLKVSRKKVVGDHDKPRLEATTLWDYPKQSYGKTQKGSNKYAGVTPAFVIYNMVKRYTEPGDLVLDPMAGSGTTIDVCKEEGRKFVAFDITYCL